MLKIYAQEDFKGPDGRTVKRGDEVCQIPKIYTLEQIVQHATLGQIADHEPPALPEVKETAAKSPSAAAATPAMPAKVK